MARAPLFASADGQVKHLLPLQGGMGGGRLISNTDPHLRACPRFLALAGGGWACASARAPSVHAFAPQAVAALVCGMEQELNFRVLDRLAGIVGL